MTNNLFILSALACQISDCLNENELSLLAANLTVLTDMLAATALQKSKST